MGLTVVRPRDEINWVAFFLGEEPVVRTEPGPVLRVGTWVVGEPAQADIAAYGGEIPPGRMYDVEYPL